MSRVFKRERDARVGGTATYVKLRDAQKQRRSDAGFLAIRSLTRACADLGFLCWRGMAAAKTSVEDWFAATSATSELHGGVTKLGRTSVRGFVIGCRV